MKWGRRPYLLYSSSLRRRPWPHVLYMATSPQPASVNMFSKLSYWFQNRCLTTCFHSLEHLQTRPSKRPPTAPDRAFGGHHCVLPFLGRVAIQPRPPSVVPQNATQTAPALLQPKKDNKKRHPLSTSSARRRRGRHRRRRRTSAFPLRPKTKLVPPPMP
jgi:hypothetical protein